jgi:hypothetical protein
MAEDDKKKPSSISKAPPPPPPLDPSGGAPYVAVGQGRRTTPEPVPFRSGLEDATYYGFGTAPPHSAFAAAARDAEKSRIDHEKENRQHIRASLEGAFEQHKSPVDPLPATASNPSGEMSMGHDTLNESTAYTFLDYAGLGFILVPTEEIGRRWIDDLPITSHTLIAAGTVMFVGAVLLALSKAIKRAVIPKGALFQDFARLANKAWFWVFVAILIVFGVPIMVSYVSPPKRVAVNIYPDTTVTLCSDGPCAPLHVKPGRPQYLKSIGLGTGPEPLSLLAIPATTTDRLRVFVDYSEYRSGWMDRTRAFIGDLKEPVRDKAERLQMIYSAIMPNGGTNNLWWGDPKQNQPVSSSYYNGDPLPAALVRGRVVIVGPEGEQYYYFVLVRAAGSAGTQIGIIPQHDSGDWIEKWEAD